MIKAQLVELNPGSARPKTRTRVVMQFNPETLHISHSHPVMASDSRGTTTLRMHLWFDLSADESAAAQGDVRQITRRIASFIAPHTAQARPIIRFTWGTFQFDGVVEAMDETLELFSADGRPLRASVSLTLSSDRIQP